MSVNVTFFNSSLYKTFVSVTTVSGTTHTIATFSDGEPIQNIDSTDDRFYNDNSLPFYRDGIESTGWVLKPNSAITLQHSQAHGAIPQSLMRYDTITSFQGTSSAYNCQETATCTAEVVFNANDAVQSSGEKYLGNFIIQKLGSEPKSTFNNPNPLEKYAVRFTNTSFYDVYITDYPSIQANVNETYDCGYIFCSNEYGNTEPAPPPDYGTSSASAQCKEPLILSDYPGFPSDWFLKDLGAYIVFNVGVGGASGIIRFSSGSYTFEYSAGQSDEQGTYFYLADKEIDDPLIDQNTYTRFRYQASGNYEYLTFQQLKEISDTWWISGEASSISTLMGQSNYGGFFLPGTNSLIKRDSIHIKCKINGEWKTSRANKVKVNNELKSVKKIYVKINDQWKQG